ncbi:MAG TPA: glycosyltransferase family 39 protein [Solirubrobacteraceae bacterium]|nr:glycosyltransferase family 39 protein [Solirubrobacteraceae bacterium]
MAIDAEILRRPVIRRSGAGGIALPEWSAPAWASLGLVLAFLGVACWWLSQDRSIPVYDSGSHLSSAIAAYEALGSGRLGRALTAAAPYPPLTFLVGALGVFAGGVDVAPPIIAQDLVFVALLALGCYQVGRLAFGSTAGLLAVVFALGSPLIIEEFHEFMLDAPEAAMVAVSLWAILASERFSRLGVSALAGLAVGLGMLSKETFVYFLAGVVLVALIRGGRSAWRGAAVFAAVALVVTLPWYLYELPTIHALGNEALGSSSHLSTLKIFPGIAPPRLSGANLAWYFWSIVNWQLLVPLFAFALAGLTWALVGFARRRPVSAVAPELVAGTLVSWLILTATYVHDPRYALPMEAYFAVLAGGWISNLRARRRLVAAGALALVALANTLGVSFGLGSPVATGSENATYEQQPGRLTLYSNYGFWIGPPQTAGKMLSLLRTLRRDGVREVWVSEQQSEIEYSYPGMLALARIAGLHVPSSYPNPDRVGRAYAYLSRGEALPSLEDPCVTLKNGAGIWVRRGGPQASGAWGYCPLRSGSSRVM